MHEIMEQLSVPQFDQYFWFQENVKLFPLHVYHRITVSVKGKIKRFHMQTELSEIKSSENTCLLAGTGLAVIQTVCHVLPGINIRELSLPLVGLPSLVDAAKENKQNQLFRLSN